jgi:hypothetical protein
MNLISNFASQNEKIIIFKQFFHIFTLSSCGASIYIELPLVR